MIVGVGALLLAAGTAVAETDAGFAPGLWEGTATSSGSIAKSNVSASGGGKVSFTMIIGTDGKASGGMDETAHSSGRSGAGGRASLNFAGEYTIAGNAQNVTYTGDVQMTGTASSGSLSLPINTTLPVNGNLVITSATCKVVTGDMAVNARRAQKAAGFRTTFTAPFIAVKQTKVNGVTLSPATQKQMGDKFLEAVAKLEAVDGKPATVPDLRAALAAIENVFAVAAGQQGCRGGSDVASAMRGDTNLHIMFAQAVKRLAASGAATSADLLAAASMAAQLGLLDSTYAGPQTVKELDGAIENAMMVAVANAIRNGDRRALTDLAYGAGQYGYPDVAAAALKGLKK